MSQAIFTRKTRKAAEKKFSAANKHSQNFTEKNSIRHEKHTAETAIFKKPKKSAAAPPLSALFGRKPAFRLRRLKQ